MTTMKITKAHTDKAYRMGQAHARYEIEHARETPQEDLWGDLTEVEVFQDATGFKPQEASSWQQAEVTDQFENGYYDTFIDEGMGN